MSEDKKSIKIGAGWTKESKSGNAYVSFSLDIEAIEETIRSLVAQKADLKKINVSMFENTKKKEDRQPDYFLMFFPRTTKE